MLIAYKTPEAVVCLRVVELGAGVYRVFAGKEILVLG